MAAHVLLINLVAPALARAWLLCGAVREQSFAPGRMFLGAAAAQLVLLWVWHAPGAIAFSSNHAFAHALMSTLLLGASLAFWLAILAATGAARWRGIFGLAATGKLSCLLGALLLLAPRVLNLDDSLGLAARDPEAALFDQRLAGLLMLAACPLCYVLTGVKLAVDWLRELEAHGSRQACRTSHRPPLT
jgi:putative membrane protein